MTKNKQSIWISICVALGFAATFLAQDSFAQQTNFDNDSSFQNSIQTNQPARINTFQPLVETEPARDLWTQPQTTNVPNVLNSQYLSNNLPNDVRNQIGLASFEEEVKNANDAGPRDTISDLFASQTEKLTSREGIGSSVKVAILLAALSLAPALVLMTTCYIRVIVVLSLLKQAFGAQQLPPTQVLTALSLFVTLLVMTPVWNEIKTEAIDPYQAEDGISWNEAWDRGVAPVKTFMATQIESAGNGESIAMFYRYLPDHQSMAPPTSAQEVPINVLLPAFMVSELKVAFLLGFQIFLPFLVLDLVVSSVTVSTGMLMLPPTMVSFPLKLILFVLVDGWNLVIGMLLQSFQTFP